MYKLSLIATFLLATGATAQERDVGNICKNAGLAAKAIMQKRQVETPMHEVYADLLKSDPTGKRHSIYLRMLTEAYEQPTMPTPESRELQEKRFRNHFESICFSGFLKDR